MTELIMSVQTNSNGAPNFATAEVIDAVEVVRGEWIDKMNYRDGSYYSICSECGYFDDERDDLTAYNFCPYCGAKMKGADDE